MIKNLFFVIVFVLSIIHPGKGADLYLVKIDNQERLNAAKEIAGTARGMVGESFLADLTALQADQLSRAGVSIEMVMRDYSGRGLFLITPVSSKIVSPPSNIKVIYSHGGNYLAELKEDKVEWLQQNGFEAQPIGEKETPFFCHPPDVSVPSFDSYPCDTLANLISMDSLYSYVHRLELFQSRYVASDSLASARDWIVSKFHEFGYDSVVLDEFTYDGKPYHNVICVKTGIANPSHYIVIGGHYDSRSSDSDPAIWAPGADDNASGTAAVLELARILKDAAFNNSILFTAFSAEEVNLVGSTHMAMEMYTAGSDINFMLNFDMIGYTKRDADSVIFRGSTRRYIFADACLRLVEGLTPYTWITGVMSTDERPFAEMGYPIVGAMEFDFNSNNYHSSTDISDSLNFPYMEKILKASSAALGVIDNACPPVHFRPYDVGDGHTIRVILDSCDASLSYQILYSTSRSVVFGFPFDYSIDFPPGAYYCDIPGLGEYTTYYMSVKSIDAMGYHSIEFIVDSLYPLHYPRQPQLLSVYPEGQSIVINWRQNLELDMNHYQVLRKDSLNDWTIIGNNITDTSYRDSDLDSHMVYTYVVKAVDNDSYASYASIEGSAVMATFDWPLLFAEETDSSGINPSNYTQQIFYNSIFTGYAHNTYIIDSTLPPLAYNQLSQYKTLYYFDDDNIEHLLNYSLNSINWFLTYPNNMLLAGFQSVFSVTGNSFFYPGNSFYDEFGLSRVENCPTARFIQPVTQGDWPELELKDDAVYYGNLPGISIFEGSPYAKVIYRFKSNPPGIYFDGKPVGIVYDSGHGKRVVLGFPIYYLTVPSAQALLAKVQEYFSQPPIYGDANHDDIINVLDITFLINHLYKGGSAPFILNNADPNADCRINLLDITYLINFLYKSGPPPKIGCM